MHVITDENNTSLANEHSLRNIMVVFVMSHWDAILENGPKVM